jgi:hypothetical protein
MLCFGMAATNAADTQNTPTTGWGVTLPSFSNSAASQQCYLSGTDTNFATLNLTPGDWNTGGATAGNMMTVAVQASTSIPAAAATTPGRLEWPWGEHYNGMGRVPLSVTGGGNMFDRNIRKAMTRRMEVGSTDATDMIMRNYILEQPAGPGQGLVRSQGVKRAGSF